MKYLVETISMFRMRYVVDTDSPDYAADSVTMGDVEEFSQKHLDEIISSVRAVSDEECANIFFEDHDYIRRDYDPDRWKRNVWQG